MTEAERKATGGKTSGAPPGKRWVGNTCKHHTLISPNGKVLASAVTDGDTAGSTILAILCPKIPEGSGNAIWEGNAYCPEDNCKMAVQTGRQPYFEPKKDYQGNGLGAWAKMIQLRGSTPAGSTISSRPDPPSRPASRPSRAGSRTASGP